MYEIKIITTNDKAYNKVLAIRQQVLRDPLGLNLFDEDLSKELNHTIFICEADGEIVGCALVHMLIPSSYKLRQMAVLPEWQHKGVGTAIVKYAETYLQEKGVNYLSFYARITAIDFYSNLNYVAIGEPFEEVGIPHIEMVKKLS